MMHASIKNTGYIYSAPACQANAAPLLNGTVVRLKSGTSPSACASLSSGGCCKMCWIAAWLRSVYPLYALRDTAVFAAATLFCVCSLWAVAASVTISCRSLAASESSLSLMAPFSVCELAHVVHRCIAKHKKHLLIRPTLLQFRRPTRVDERDVITHHPVNALRENMIASMGFELKGP